MRRERAALERADAKARTPQERYCPHTPFPKQREFLALQRREALYGGAGGGGKSDALLMGALEHVDVPGFAALILRRTFADLKLADAIMDRSHQWLRNTDATWIADTKTWRFPSGATITFGYLQDEADKFRYQSAAFQYIAFDELTQFTESQYSYLFTRLRRLTGSTVEPKMRSATNPGGPGHDWVKARWAIPDDGESGGTETRAFLPAKVEDNPALDANDYHRSLAEVDETTREQIERGRWVRYSGGLIYPYVAARNGVLALPEREDWLYTVAWDFGASKKKATDAYAVGAFSYSHKTAYLVRSEAFVGISIDDIADKTHELEAEFGSFVEIGGDLGGLAPKIVDQLVERFSIPMVGARKADKLGNRRLMRGQLERGTLKVVAPGNRDLIKEMLALEWNEQGNDCAKGADDHLTDAALYAWRAVQAHYAEEQEDRPEPGTSEALKAETKALWDNDVAQAERDRSREWWENT